MIRFLLGVCVAFVAAFGSVYWAVRGFPLPWPSVSVEPLSTTVDLTFGDDTALRKHWAAVQTQISTPEHAARNDIRLAALQAANAYALAPCGPGFKDELVKTLTVYAKAYMDMRGCTFIACSDKKVDAAGAAFDSPLDKRVQAALKDAFDQGGITIDEFPRSLRIGVLNFAQGQGTPASRCNASAQNGAR